MRPIIGVIPSLGANKERLNSCIQSINQQSLRSFVHLIVVDNSRDSLLRNLNDVDEVLTPRCNLGYNAAIEYARRKYSSEYLWLLQDDLVVHENALVNLIERMNADERLGCVSPKAVRGNFLPMGVRA
jgi:GT2 family glycosyltransferase